MKSEDIISNIKKSLVRRYSAERIILYGSYAWGKPAKDSDIDILIIKDTTKKPAERFMEVQRILHGLHGKVPVEPLVLTPKELKKRVILVDPFILKIIKDGKGLHG